ncbi:hypothetical protein AB0E63_32435 [Kribbella sp. NPDC026596]|uniref:hypothetical protein n=1 Tax=Kribbella sp. NPDC026596 TaxID=3155122 RepID=UPI0033F708D1
MSDPQPPAWNPENDETRAYGAPPPPQYGTPPQQPQYGGPPQQYQYGGPPPPPQYGAPPQQPYYGQPPQQPPKSKTPWLLAGGIALVLALIGGAGVVLATRGGSDDAEAGGPMPTATYSDGLTSGSPSPTAPSYTPFPPTSPKPTRTFPTPTERRRTLKDIDQGLKVYDDVYVKPAAGWRKEHQTKYSVSLLAPGRGAAYIIVSPIAYRADQAAPQAADTVISIDHWIAARKEPVETVTPANSNIDTQAQIALSGRIHTKTGGSISMVARCTVMTGVESIHNVTVIVCVEGRKDDPNAAFKDMPRMLASVARSI